MSQRIKNKQIVVTSDFDLAGNKIINLSSPSGSTDGANKAYVDSVGSSLSASALQPWVDINRNGFVDNTQTSISFNDTTYLFTLSGLTAWSYYRGGIKYTVTGDRTVTLPSTAGTYYITINSTDGTLQSGNTVWTLQDTTLPVAVIRLNISLSPKYHMAEERHTVAIDRKLHQYLHQTRGTQFVSGGGLDGPTLNNQTDAANTFGVSQTTIADEDLYQTLSGLTRPNGTVLTYNVFFRTSATTWTWAPSEVPFLYSPTYILWDNNGVMATGVTNGYYNTYLLFTDLNLTGRYTIVHGRGEYSSVANAQAESPLTFDWTGLPVAESVIAYQFTWGTSNSYNNKGKCRLVATPKQLNIATTTTVGSSAGVDHNSLAGLQGGSTTERYHLSNADYITVTGISSSLSTEISIRSGADSSLASAISSESSTRTSADSSLASIIDNLDYNTSDIDMSALSGTSGQYLATNTTISQTPKTRVRVEINSVEVTVGNGTKTAFCYFSGDNGTTARTYTNVSLGDKLYWNGDVALYQLETNDTITFIYMTF